MVAIKQQHMNSKRVHTGYTLTTEDSQKKGIIIARSSCTVLQDYVDTNLLKAVPLQFPYGIGNLNLEENCRSGTSYLQYLLTS